MARAAFLLLSVLLWVAGCQPDEYSILISARSQADVEAVVVTVIPLSGGRTFPSGQFRVDRTAADIDENEPIRIAIGLDGPREVLVHIRADGPEGRMLVATRCYAVTGVVHDSVLLVQTDGLDMDGDGWLDNTTDTCFSAEGTRCTAHQCVDGEDVDCRSEDATYHPGAQELCADGEDQDCNGEDAPCGDDDGDGHDQCSGSDMPGTCDCNDDIGTIHPGAEEMCGDGVDQDCDGNDRFCDNDGDEYPSDVDCNDDDPAVNPGAAEVCTVEGGTAVDEDCDGLVDELISCADDDLDNDGHVACGLPGAPVACDQNDCDAGIHPEAFDYCGNGVDEDGDGIDRPCREGDLDHDDVPGTASGGSDCDDGNPRIFPGAPERCGDGIAQGCTADVPCDGDLDGDGYVETAACEGNAAAAPWLEESCNALDDDCDLTSDEVLNMSVMGYPQGLTGCISASPTVPMCATDACVVDFTSNIFHCGTCWNRCNPNDDRNIADRCVDGMCDCEPETATEGPCMGVTDACCPEIGCVDVRNGPPEHCGGCNEDCNVEDGVRRPEQLPAADRCVDGACMCGATAACLSAGSPVTNACCGGACTNPQTDSNNCGACGNRCGPNSHCEGGVCICNSADLRDCDGMQITGCEVDIRTDELHCGACGAACSTVNATPTCSSGACTLACRAGFDNCDGNVGDGCETSLDSLANCGGCGVSCDLPNASESCGTGSCRVMDCDAGWGNCDGNHANGCELRLNTLTNCGGCGVSCDLPNASESCGTGTCVLGACDAGYGNCNMSGSDGCEQRLNTTSHCGGCNVACNPANATGTCTTETCAIDSCDPLWEDCDGSLPNGCETDLTDPDTCGSCSTSCTDPPGGLATCDGTSCGFLCMPDYHLCVASCVSDDDVNTCGTRCTPCAAPMNATATCTGNPEVCGFTCDSGYCRMGGSCVGNDSPDACGSGCVDCPNRANATPTCMGGACGFTCNMGWDDCDGDPMNGCEQDLTVNGNCGMCGRTCPGTQGCCSDATCDGSCSG